jgi:DNA polymerase-3 subunit alpha (Gram-positive type)
MAYRQAWYKIHRPMEFYAAYFSIRADEFDASTMTRGAERAKMRLAELNEIGRDINPREQKILTILEVVVEMHARGIGFLPVDLYRSDAKRFLIEGGGLRPPLVALSGLGAAAAEGICAARNGKPFISIEDMMAKARLSKSIVEILREYGALEGMARESQLSLFDL